jgi:1-acyl-sn-glycerol-3-phosphate acyltransferase
MNVIPVERDGNDMTALREVIKKVKAGNGIVLFPEGTRSKDGNLQPGRAGIGLVISKTGAPVLPVRIFGAYDAFPKNAKHLHFSQITVVLGEPIHFSEEELSDPSRDAYQKLSNRVMSAIGSLKIS